MSCPIINWCTFTSGYPNASWRQFDWYFGDGSTATGRTVTHTFSAVGTYFIFHGAYSPFMWPTDDRMFIVRDNGGSESP